MPKYTGVARVSMHSWQASNQLSATAKPLRLQRRAPQLHQVVPEGDRSGKTIAAEIGDAATVGREFP